MSSRGARLMAVFAFAALCVALSLLNIQPCYATDREFMKESRGLLASPGVRLLKDLSREEVAWNAVATYCPNVDRNDPSSFDVYTKPRSEVGWSVTRGLVRTQGSESTLETLLDDEAALTELKQSTSGAIVAELVATQWFIIWSVLIAMGIIVLVLGLMMVPSYWCSGWRKCLSALFCYKCFKDRPRTTPIQKVSNVKIGVLHCCSIVFLILIMGAAVGVALYYSIMFRNAMPTLTCNVQRVMYEADYGTVYNSVPNEHSWAGEVQSGGSWEGLVAVDTKISKVKTMPALIKTTTELMINGLKAYINKYKGYLDESQEGVKELNALATKHIMECRICMPLVNELFQTGTKRIPKLQKDLDSLIKKIADKVDSATEGLLQKVSDMQTRLVERVQGVIDRIRTSLDTHKTTILFLQGRAWYLFVGISALAAIGFVWAAATHFALWGHYKKGTEPKWHLCIKSTGGLWIWFALTGALLLMLGSFMLLVAAQTGSPCVVVRDGVEGEGHWSDYSVIRSLMGDGQLSAAIHECATEDGRGELMKTVVGDNMDSATSDIAEEVEKSVNLTVDIPITPTWEQVPAIVLLDPANEELKHVQPPYDVLTSGCQIDDFEPTGFVKTRLQDVELPAGVTLSDSKVLGINSAYASVSRLSVSVGCTKALCSGSAPRCLLGLTGDHASDVAPTPGDTGNVVFDDLVKCLAKAATKRDVAADALSAWSGVVWIDRKLRVLDDYEKGFKDVKFPDARNLTKTVDRFRNQALAYLQTDISGTAGGISRGVNCKAVFVAASTVLDSYCSEIHGNLIFVFVAWVVIGLCSIIGWVLAWRLFHYMKDRLQRLDSVESEVTPCGSALLVAALHGDAKKVQFILENGVDPNDYCDELNNYALHNAAFSGSMRCVQFLIQYGADVNAPNAVSNTPLFIATNEGHEEVVRLLLRHGADPSCRNENGDTPLHSAAKRGSPRVVRALVEGGADLTERGELSNALPSEVATDPAVEIYLKAKTPGRNNQI